MAGKKTQDTFPQNWDPPDPTMVKAAILALHAAMKAEREQKPTPPPRRRPQRA
jgi:hypothetical protein